MIALATIIVCVVVLAIALALFTSARDSEASARRMLHAAEQREAAARRLRDTAFGHLEEAADLGLIKHSDVALLRITGGG